MGIIIDPMAWNIWDCINVAIIFFAIAMLALGIFAAYFGKGKNRTYGLIMAVVGLIVLVVWAYLCVCTKITPFCDIQIWNTILFTIIPLVSLLIGVLAAAGIFLVTVLKS